MNTVRVFDEGEKLKYLMNLLTGRGWVNFCLTRGLYGVNRNSPLLQLFTCMKQSKDTTRSVQFLGELNDVFAR